MWCWWRGESDTQVRSSLHGLTWTPHPKPEHARHLNKQGPEKGQLGRNSDKQDGKGMGARGDKEGNKQQDVSKQVRVRSPSLPRLGHNLFPRYEHLKQALHCLAACCIRTPHTCILFLHITMISLLHSLPRATKPLKFTICSSRCFKSD